jgi:hypothetical protein
LTATGVHCLPVNSVVVTATPRQALSFSLQTNDAAKPTEEFGPAINMSTPSVSNQRRAIAAPTSALF